MGIDICECKESQKDSSIARRVCFVACIASRRIAEEQKKLKVNIFEALVRWLGEEYPEDDARSILSKAKIFWEDNPDDSVIAITYENNVVDRVRIDTEQMIVTKHLKNESND